MRKSVKKRVLRTFFKYYYLNRKESLIMNTYLSAFLKSVVLSGISVGAMYSTNEPSAAFATPIFAIAMKYISDNWK